MLSSSRLPLEPLESSWNVLDAVSVQHAVSLSMTLGKCRSAYESV